MTGNVSKIASIFVTSFSCSSQNSELPNEESHSIDLLSIQIDKYEKYNVHDIVWNLFYKDNKH